MAHHRSPNCPQIPFAEAIEKGRKVYTKEFTHPAAKAVVAGDLGYSGLNGRSLTLIGALRQYGILEGAGDALRVSKDAVSYFVLEDGRERRAAIQRMTLAPSLFAELNEQFQGTLPSEANLRHTLINKGFGNAAAAQVAEVYKANMALVATEEKVYSERVEEANAQMNLPPAPANLPPGKPASAVQTYVFALSPEACAELSLRGSIARDDLELLRDHVELTIKALAKSAKENAQ